MREGEARLPIEEQLSLKLRRFHRGQRSRGSATGFEPIRLLEAFLRRSVTPIQLMGSG